MLSRLSITLLVGAALMVGMFWVLWGLISVTPNVGEQLQAQRIEFTRQRRESEVQTKEEEQVKREKPPEVPQTPQMSYSSGSIGGNVVAVNVNINPTGGLGKLGLSAGTDTDVLPLVRIPPEYPPRAAERGIEGWVIVQFTITATGAVKDPKIVDAHPKHIFDEAVLRAIARWRFQPKVEGGQPVERVGVQTRLVFQLKK